MNAGPEAMLSEFREEAVTTKRILDRVPADKLSWRRHAKSMSLGQLALHIAAIPGSIAKLAQLDEFDASQANFEPPAPKDLSEIHSTLDESVRSAEEHLTLRGEVVFAKPRAGVLRSIMLNHWYHHRGQLSSICGCSMFRFPKSTAVARMKTHLGDQWARDRPLR